MIKVPADSGSGTQVLVYGPLLIVLRGWKGKGPFLALFYKDTNAIHEGSTPMTNHPHQRFYFKVLTLWVRISPHEFGEGEHKYSDHNISLAQSPSRL